MTAADVMRELKEVHEAYDEGTIEFDDFEARKSELLDRLAAGFDDET